MKEIYRKISVLAVFLISILAAGIVWEYIGGNISGVELPIVFAEMNIYLKGFLRFTLSAVAGAIVFAYAMRIQGKIEKDGFFGKEDATYD